MPVFLNDMFTASSFALEMGSHLIGLSGQVAGGLERDWIISVSVYICLDMVFVMFIVL